MITTIVLFSVYAATTSSALKISSPVHIIRPLDNVHTNCKLDVQEFCSQTNAHIQHAPITLGTHDQNTPNENGKGESKDTRRLSEVEHKTASISRQYSIAVGLRITSKNLGEQSIQRAKNTKRFLNYGPNVDMCLWNVFDTQQISSQCASALTFVNNSEDSTPCYYDNDPTIQKVYTKVSVSFSGGTLCMFILCCLLFKHHFYDDDDDDNDDDDDDKVASQLDGKNHEYQLLTELGNEAFVAVPVQVV